MKLHVQTFVGNMFNAATAINISGLAEYVVTMEISTGLNTIVVFKMPDDLVYKLRDANSAYRADVHHDDVVQPQRRESDKHLPASLQEQAS